MEYIATDGTGNTNDCTFFVIVIGEYKVYNSISMMKAFKTKNMRGTTHNYFSLLEKYGMSNSKP